MSLIGSELNLELNFDSLEPEPLSADNNMRNNNEAADRATTEEDRSTPRISNEHNDDDGHEPPTPKTGIESFFLGELSTERVSAAALAQELRHGRLSSLDDFKTATSDDFKTAKSDQLSLADSAADDDGDDTKPKELFTQDALELSRDLPIDDTEEEDEPEVTKENISTMATTVTSTTPVTAPTPATSEPADEPMNVDPAEKVYDVAKGIWGWGKGVIIFSPFLGIAEGIAGKVVETAGSSLEDVDNALTGKLHQLDDGILNPAVKMVVTTVMGAAGKTEAFIKPIILTILKPIDFMIKSKPEESDDTPAPEVTPDVAMN